ncbi:hypothetical protein C0J52_18130 [Blattella germanica]|nr:hypothetical protein C0J52_18130 [Blattella germanica]
MTDTSFFSIEERLVVSVWVHERQNTKKTIRDILRDFSVRFGKPPPSRPTLFTWEKKAFSTGSVRDAPPAVNELFPNRWIGRGSRDLPAPLPWPPRSPDLTTPDNTLWGVIKEEVRKQQYVNDDQLKNGVRIAFHKITPVMLQKMNTRMWRRINLCM